MSARLRRLHADQQSLASAFAAHTAIRVVPGEGTPPERYQVEFQVRGLVPGIDGKPVAKARHQAEILLPLDYPRRPPFCRMTTPVYHPNIDPQKICIGDHWSAGQSLPDLVVRIAEMICFQSFNTKSPLNAEAAAWAEEHAAQLPLQADDFQPG
jgi:ubiquitin-protein ligase